MIYYSVLKLKMLTEEIDLLKKQGMERLELMRNDSRMENEVEQVNKEALLFYLLFYLQHFYKKCSPIPLR